ncbi:hypothetical protein GCM10009639_09350 [Kitasatospora putterlickiae]|uniref:Secreted protein n=1 Tax=Kitasatospora putterlickiae TaxID=221725 RepID=A0ABN1XPB2_9ACTN
MPGGWLALALASLAVVFPTDRTLPALTAHPKTFIHRHPQGSDIGDYVCFVLVLAARDEARVLLSATEKLTGACWTGTGTGSADTARAFHFLAQMPAKAGARLTWCSVEE